MRRLIVYLLVVLTVASGGFVAWYGLGRHRAPDTVPTAAPTSARGPAATAPETPAPGISAPGTSAQAPGPGPMPTPAAYAFLRLPVDCRVGDTCWVLNYMDDDPGQGVADHACGPRSYDGHDGTDFAVQDLAAMRAGVRVVAAAAGRVSEVRDGMPDRRFEPLRAAEAGGRECGNGVVIDHGNGWQTQYCHMMRDSVHVRPGQEVGAGAHLGYLGMSGEAEFPHLHFTVRQGGRAMDPFLDPTAPAPGCAAVPRTASLWLPEAAAMLAYSPLDLVALGAADREPDAAAILNGDYASPVTAARTAPVLAAWAMLAGSEPGDRLTLSLLAPDGKSVAENTVTLDRPRAREVRFVGRKRRGGAWPAGLYRLTATVERPAATAGAEPLRRQAERMLLVR